MTMRDLDYQGLVLDRLDKYLEELAAQKKSADKVAELALANPDIEIDLPDFPAKTWDTMRKGGHLPEARMEIPYSSRVDGANRAVPNIVLKVPTGGGKTFLAVAAMPKIFGKYLGTNKGFVLWIVPNEAIYSQTKRQLEDRQHPYRQMLDVMSGNAVRIMEKDDPLNAMDVESHLCVMLLMLQSSNRENKDSLKMFRDRGDVHGFFPPEGDQEAHSIALSRTPNLDVYDLSGSAYPWTQVKDSLGNALRLIRPVVVMDEGHKAVSDLAFSTLYGFNPCFVLELTATPKDVAPTTGKNPKPGRSANVLVEVRGIDLEREGMIKMPLNLDPREAADWRSSLSAGLSRIKDLKKTARNFQANTGRYIRPIMLVQVERTGADKRDGTHVHALDAKEWLMNIGGLDEDEIAIKTSDTNDLASPENQDLLSTTNRIRVIITKQALQEGWDCPFAYVLCVLAASSNMSAMTQLVGRILRQPGAQKTGVPALDESYVITHHAETAPVVSAIKQGLEEDGMGDLVSEIRTSGSNSNSKSRKIKRRSKFAATGIFLPQVMRIEDDKSRLLDYEEDILFALEWEDLDVSSFVTRIPDNISGADKQMRRIRLSDSGERIIDEVAGSSEETLEFDTPYAVRMISDIVLNAWCAREIVGNVVSGLKFRGFDQAKLGKTSSSIVGELRKWLSEQRDSKAEKHFLSEVAAGKIQFRLRADGANWSMPFEIETTEPEGADQLIGKNGEPLEKSLFSPLYKGDFSNKDERDVAVFLDGEKTLMWWHRNIARQHYAVQGWRREKIFPDFVFAIQPQTKGTRVAVLEMKGDHLAGNDDTAYKKKVLEIMTKAYKSDRAPAGQMDLKIADVTIHCDMILFSEKDRRLPDLFK